MVELSIKYPAFRDGSRPVYPLRVPDNIMDDIEQFWSPHEATIIVAKGVFPKLDEWLKKNSYDRHYEVILTSDGKIFK